MDAGKLLENRADAVASSSARSLSSARLGEPSLTIKGSNKPMVSPSSRMISSAILSAFFALKAIFNITQYHIDRINNSINMSCLASASMSASRHAMGVWQVGQTHPT